MFDIWICRRERTADNGTVKKTRDSLASKQFHWLQYDNIGVHTMVTRLRECSVEVFDVST